jgi:hypothetical protein
MKKLAILLLTISLSVNAGWFGNSIEGAFGLELGEKKKINQKKDKYDSYDYTPNYPLNLFSEEFYSYRLTPENKIYYIKFSAMEDYSKCTSNPFNKLLHSLKNKYKKIKLKKTVIEESPVPITRKYVRYEYIEDNRGIRLECTERKGVSFAGNVIPAYILIELGYYDDIYRDKTPRILESIL